MPVEEEEPAQQIWAVLGQSQPQLEKQLVPPFPQGILSPSVVTCASLGVPGSAVQGTASHGTDMPGSCEISPCAHVPPGALSLG